ncbi:MAG: shikimate dehydrogenase [Verrucomicrobia bacterium]|nr:shikimate dehydrogenase [Verrucomicrobiota bacterium]MCG2680167.1 shikimate dehydrogenase [Kiritimatiellia bacterium]MBU4246767.1 shikimate dehydrogenase [Verrucomicrobiota bacterium]MBU4290704.1 shikimate dehydrogenase [Verrucomicrobiota bacterium]MBU4429867.1 shikimate dehydrogenase [Verrucomicrobiota bacterium]
MINPSTKLYAVLGHPIRHSLSPVMQNAAMTALNMDAVYLAFDVPPEKLMRSLEFLGELGFSGVNLTVPLKEVAFRGIANLDESARRLGSVNTVKFTPQGLEGYSTDGEGFLRAIREVFQFSVMGRSLFILGCGGAGRAVALASVVAGADRLLLADKELSRVRKLEQEITALPRKVQVQVVAFDPTAWTQAGREADLVVHATPIGMHPEEASPLAADAFRPGQLVFDLIYMFPETAVMKVARERGASVSNGLGMLLHQGARSFAIWTGVEPPVDVMRRVLERGVYGT